MSGSKIVTTFTGLKEKRSDCKRIKGEFYKVGDINIKDSGECYLVEGKFHRFNNGYIEYDYESESYVLKHKNTLRYGIVDFVKGQRVMGFFTPNITKNIILYNSENILCLSEEIANKGGFKERYADGIFYDGTSKPDNWYTKIGKAPISKSSLPYDSRFVTSIVKESYDNLYNPEMNSSNINKLGDFLERNEITFGLEFETVKGYIPDRITHKLGLIPLRDGSISGLEYVTIPMSGKKGLYAVKEICEVLAKRTSFDHNCALHLHLGGVSREKSSILSTFILGCLIQDEMMLLQPSYKKGGSGLKDKDYCKLLPIKRIFGNLPKIIDKSNLDRSFSSLFNFISDGTPFERYDSSLNNVESHPSDPSGQRKWQIMSRYFWLNFVPITFGNKKTVEFRHHTCTNDFEKIINFIFLCAAFIVCSEKYKDEILNNESEIYNKLLKSPNKSIETILTFLEKKGDNDISDLVKRSLEYNSIRKSIMEAMTEEKDFLGITEHEYDCKYEELDQKFW